MKQRTSQPKTNKNPKRPLEAVRQRLRQTQNNAICKRKSFYRTPPVPRPCFEFRKDPDWFVRNVCSPIDLRVINFFIGLSKQYRYMYPSQNTIGACIGKSREEVNRSIHRLREWGILTADYRHYRTSIYKLTSLFQLPKVIVSLCGLLKNMLKRVTTYLTQASKSYVSKYKYNTKSSGDEREFSERLRRAIKNQEIANKHVKCASNLPPVVCLPKPCQILSRRRREREMTKKTKDLVKTIEKISETLNLTLYGKSKLAIFPIAALHYANKELIRCLENGVNLENPFGFVYYTADKYCQNAGMSINYEAYDKLEKKHNFTTEEEPTFADVDPTLHFKEKPKALQKQTNNIHPYEHKKEKPYSMNHEQEGYKTLESSDTFQKTANLFGEFFEKCKKNILAKAT